MLRYIVFFVFTGTFANGINWHSSQIILRHLYDLQDEQFAVIKEYLELETKRIHDLERYINYLYEKDTLLSPIGTSKFMSQVYKNLSEIKKLMNNYNSVKVINQFDEHKAVSEFNMQSAYRSLRRIQKVYAIPASDMAAGRYKDRTIGDPMDACECYFMSKYSFEEYDTYGVIDWAVQAYNKWFTDRPKCVDIDKLHYYTRSASMATGFSFETLLGFSNLNHSDYTELSAHFSLMANALNIRDISAQSSDKIYDKYDDFEQSNLFRHFRYLCREGKSVRPLTYDSKCRYQTKNSPYRMIMPFKEEDISSNPNIKLYHDIIYDEEIKTITDMASKDLSDAAYYFNGKITLLDDQRLGQLKWFSENANPILFGKLNDRIECITEYTTKTAEGYQTINYGLGGHFSVHMDAFTDGPKLNGNRLVTILFYMTDVPDDGYTVFPNLNYVAHCRKGSALVWLNLRLNNGSVHSGTFHGGCPVIKGNKWIMTKGLYEEGQHLTYNWRDNKIINIV
ncbi:prolyl 4-hydroxylase subunit alpha-2-like isoform X1 [Acyrthosiphon pisum]|uniref:procollagen-proline 4-dioxygenase n=1 Tax=Acyrthosiphon pisum TaxID=7029 RepID=A0A8R2D2W3_ACYPI|nr:prolyl 4-hydroxylase subunit alpha-2-like isoform X1 [Acyrthosiphon pisum]|eukprot:XP_016658719.1 PREDICTED: prolyl 4-hydroxylase subunit alpha-2-like isoform X1 [Acyrthosiphon pisum]